VDAIVEMNQPGVWILGATEEKIRNTGLGVILEYENQHRQPPMGGAANRLGLHHLRQDQR